MSIPDFISFRCSNTDQPRCSSCPREFVLPLGAIEGIYKDSVGKAIVLIKSIHYCPNPTCMSEPPLFRFIETQLDYSSVISLMDGKVISAGDITLIQNAFL